METPKPKSLTYIRKSLLTFGYEFGQSFIPVDKIAIILYVTWLWAWAGLYVTKIFEFGFKLILSMPNSWLTVPAVMCDEMTTTQKKKIQVLHACNENGDITNKIKLFLRYCWEHGDDGAFDVNGFSMPKASKFLNCSLLYISYILTNPDASVEPETFFKDIQQFLIELDSTGNAFVTKEEDLSDRHPVFMGHVTLDDVDLIDEPLDMSIMGLDTMEMDSLFDDISTSTNIRRS
jgi:hypothetical protein